MKAESGTGGDFERLALPLFDSLYNFARWLAHDETEAEDLALGEGDAHGGVSWEIRRTMNCTEWQDRIDPYVDAELQPSEMAAFRTHAETCAACAAFRASHYRK